MPFGKIGCGNPGYFENECQGGKKITPKQKSIKVMVFGVAAHANVDCKERKDETKNGINPIIGGGWKEQSSNSGAKQQNDRIQNEKGLPCAAL